MDCSRVCRYRAGRAVLGYADIVSVGLFSAKLILCRDSDRCRYRTEITTPANLEKVIDRNHTKRVTTRAYVLEVILLLFSGGIY